MQPPILNFLFTSKSLTMPAVKVRVHYWFRFLAGFWATASASEEHREVDGLASGIGGSTVCTGEGFIASRLRFERLPSSTCRAGRDILVYGTGSLP